jgi:hypothetical protein
MCVESHLRELLEQGFEVAVVKDSTAGPSTRNGAVVIRRRSLTTRLWRTGLDNGPSRQCDGRGWSVSFERTGPPARANRWMPAKRLMFLGRVGRKRVCNCLSGRLPWAAVRLRRGFHVIWWFDRWLALPLAASAGSAPGHGILPDCWGLLAPGWSDLHLRI